MLQVPYQSLKCYNSKATVCFDVKLMKKFALNNILKLV